MFDIDKILKLANEYDFLCKIARIRKLPNGKYRILSEKGKNLGEYDSKSGAEKRLKQIEFFKHKDQHSASDEEVIDLTGAPEFSYSAISREMRKKSTKEQFMDFLKLYKNCFDKAIKNKLQKPEKVALQNSLTKFNKIHKIKVKGKLIKNAAVTELGDPELVGKYLSDIVKFTLTKMPIEKRQIAQDKLKDKFLHLNESDISSKNLPMYASMGQCILFVKTILFNHNPTYIRSVLNNLVKNL